MGRASLDGMLEMASQDVALEWHLLSNHYPPLPLSLVEPCKQAIEAGLEEDWQRQIPLPDGMLDGRTGKPYMTAGRLIEAAHLDSFLDVDDEQPLDESIDDDGSIAVYERDLYDQADRGPDQDDAS